MAEQSILIPVLPPRPQPILNQGGQPRGTSPVHKTLASTANLANLLPTGTVLAFQALMPSFSNGGSCGASNKYITACLIFFCASACFLSSFTDSFMGDGKLYHGIATFKGFYVFNREPQHAAAGGEEGNMKELLEKYRIRVIDFVHAVVSLIVFLMFSLGDADVLKCYSPKAGADHNALVTNLPLGAGILASFFFTLFPTTRRGIGYADLAPGV
ncbi:hypothetical protein Dimus_012228 [Dionaea muscipula]